jgi:CheY-like chemotaxis protein
MTRILVIDDNAEFRGMLKTALETTGYEVVEAKDGFEGCQLYKNSPSDLVITDIFMPEKEGLETIRDLIEHDEKVKIIAISGGGQHQYTDFLRMSKEFGASATLEKPIKIKELLAKIEELL